ncbi:MAG: phosphate:Na+ symporter [Clostridia bacterium]|nr:phosphate:Na+ symporter [Clostridia bacterium]
MDFSLVTGLLGGLALFIFGTNLISDGLQHAAAREVQQILRAFTRNRILGMLVGLVITFFLQSSAVTTVLLVGFVSAGLMSLSQALGVILGAAIGSTFTVQLIVFRISNYALWGVIIGLIPYLFARRRRWRYFGQAILGLGLIFYGVMVMTAAVEPLKNYPAFVTDLNRLASNPWLVVLLATVFTAIVQSSAGPVALAISLAGQGIITLEPALAVVLGANIGTTATGLISSLGSSREAKRVAVAHFFFKVVGALLFLPLLPYFMLLVRLTSPDIGRQIANGHTLFNAINMLIFLPFTPWVGRLLEKIVPDAPLTAKVAEYLDEAVLDVPELALSRVRQELLRMAAIIKDEMFPRVMLPLPEREVGLAEKIREMDSILDRLYQAIARYLARVTQANLSEEQSVEEAKLLYIANDLEHLGDVVVEMARQWRKLEETGLEFSERGQAELQEMYSRVQKNFILVMDAFATNDVKLAGQVIKGHPEILRLEKELRYSHFQRLQEENRWSLETSAVHMDLINSLLRINIHNVSIAQAILGII